MSALPQRLRRAAQRRARSCATRSPTRDCARPRRPAAARAASSANCSRASGAASARSGRRSTPSRRRARAAVKDFIARGWVERATRRRGGEPAGDAVATAAAACAHARAGARRRSDRRAPRALPAAAPLRRHRQRQDRGLSARSPQRVLARGGQVLMLVPEIALTPQLEAMVQARFPDTRARDACTAA